MSDKTEKSIPATPGFHAKPDEEPKKSKKPEVRATPGYQKPVTSTDSQSADPKKVSPATNPTMSAKLNDPKKESPVAKSLPAATSADPKPAPSKLGDNKADSKAAAASAPKPAAPKPGAAKADKPASKPVTPKAAKPAAPKPAVVKPTDPKPATPKPTVVNPAPAKPVNVPTSSVTDPANTVASPNLTGPSAAAQPPVEEPKNFGPGSASFVTPDSVKSDSQHVSSPIVSGPAQAASFESKPDSDQPEPVPPAKPEPPKPVSIGSDKHAPESAKAQGKSKAKSFPSVIKEKLNEFRAKSKATVDKGIDQVQGAKNKLSEAKEQAEKEAPAAPQQSVGTLVSRLSDQVHKLIVGEIELVKAKGKTMAKRVGMGAALLAVALVFALYMLGMLLHGAAHAFSVILPLWAGYLIVAGILLLIVAILALIGIASLKKGLKDTPAPQEGIKDSIDAVKKGFEQ